MTNDTRKAMEWLRPDMAGATDADLAAAVRPSTTTARRGLGDLVALVLSALWLDRLWHRISPRCRCEARRAWLNRLGAGLERVFRDWLRPNREH